MEPIIYLSIYQNDDRRLTESQIEYLIRLSTAVPYLVFFNNSHNYQNLLITVTRNLLELFIVRFIDLNMATLM